MWNGFKYISSRPANKTFNESFFMAFRWIAEYSIKPVMCTKTGISCLFLSLLTKAFLYRYSAVIKDDTLGNAVENIEDMDKCI